MKEKPKKVETRREKLIIENCKLKIANLRPGAEGRMSKRGGGEATPVLVLRKEPGRGEEAHRRSHRLHLQRVHRSLQRHPVRG